MDIPAGSGPIANASQGVTRDAPVEDLNAIQVFYNRPTDPAAFQDYLFNVHVPLVQKVPGVQRVVAHIGLTGLDQAPAEVYMIGTVVCANQAELQSALASEEGQAAYADVANFATGGFTTYLAHVEFLK